MAEWSMNNELVRIREEIDRHLIEVLSSQLSGETEEYHGDISQYSRVPYWSSKRELLKCKSTEFTAYTNLSVGQYSTLSVHTLFEEAVEAGIFRIWSRSSKSEIWWIRKNKFFNDLLPILLYEIPKVSRFLGSRSYKILNVLHDSYLQVLYSNISCNAKRKARKAHRTLKNLKVRDLLVNVDIDERIKFALGSSLRWILMNTVMETRVL